MSAGAVRSRFLGLARRCFEAARAQVPRMSHPATGYLLVLMVVAGVVLRIQNVGFPYGYGFDEEQMVSAARQFLLGLPDTGECCHPPLSKLLVGVGMLLFGDNPLGWRFASVVLGVQCLALTFFLTSTLFEDKRAGWLAAAFMAADGFCIAFSRDTFPEGMMTCFVLWSMVAAVTARGWAGVVTCAVLVGIAGSIKWSGFAVGLPACIALLLYRRVPWYSLVSFALVPFVHLGVWMIGLRLVGHPNDPISVLEEMRRRQSLHLGFVHGVNPLQSAWYTWLVMYHPIVLKSGHVGKNVTFASSVANSALFFAADLCLFAMPVVAGAAALSARFREHWRQWFDPVASRAFLILGISWLSMMLLWFTGRITSYWYHYLTPYGFAIPIVAGLASRLDRRFPKQVFVYVLLVLAVFVYFAPVWAEIPISPAAAQRRFLSPMWR
jgi:dolichyl-phosphate-mannose--protein O-mannosyl transferase